jgi:hypothetical protein
MSEEENVKIMAIIYVKAKIMYHQWQYSIMAILIINGNNENNNVNKTINE